MTDITFGEDTSHESGIRDEDFFGPREVPKVNWNAAARLLLQHFMGMGLDYDKAWSLIWSLQNSKITEREAYDLAREVGGGD